MTGLIGEWLDSVPVLYISGQVKYETTIESCKDLKLRQLGDQEINIVDIVSPVTKYAKMVTDPRDIKKIIDEAVYHAITGRPGPVWIDIPLDIQGSMIEESRCHLFEKPKTKKAIIKKEIKTLVGRLKNAKRPVIIAGNGIRISGAVKEFRKMAKKLKIPVVTSFLGCDILPSDSKYFAGRIGTIGNRYGNFAVQNSDLIIAIGTRNNIRQLSYNWKWFGREAFKVVVDLDGAELRKPTLRPDLPIMCDAGIFIREFSKNIKNLQNCDYSSWLKWIVGRREQYPVVLQEYKNVSKGLNPYYIFDKINDFLRSDDIVVTANSTPSIVFYQLGAVKKNLRVLWNSGCAAMGYALPCAIGAAIAGKNRRVICFEGDGSLQMNIQELQTVFHHKLPIILFILDNKGYVSIKQTQNSFFGGRLVGSDKNSGVSFPDFSKVARAYGLPVISISGSSNLSGKLAKVFSKKYPVIVHVKLKDNYIFSPKVSSEKKSDGRIVSKPLEDMYPFLSRKEFLKNMIIKPVKE
jgi:acetolactate synthase-1/2/3 large subunit